MGRGQRAVCGGSHVVEIEAVVLWKSGSNQLASMRRKGGREGRGALVGPLGLVCEDLFDDLFKVEVDRLDICLVRRLHGRLMSFPARKKSTTARNCSGP